MTADREVLELYRQAELNKMDIRTFDPPGPVAAEYMRDRQNVVRFLHGPVGSGKTNVNFFDKLALAHDMPRATRGPASVVGNKFHRHVEVRDTYANLWETTIKSWWGWFGPDVGLWSGGVGRRASHQLTFDIPGGGFLYYETIFVAIQDQDVDAALRGLEFTTANQGEADMQPPDVLPYLLGRAMLERYPPKRWFEPGTRYYTGVTGDMNASDPENWVYDVFEEKRPAGHRLYRQPSGRSKAGENHAWISRESYERLAEANAYRPDWVRRMIDGQKGFSRDGEPVYDQYDDITHCEERDLEPVKGLPLRLGFDQGIRGPAMVVTQWTPAGQLRVIDEFCPGRIGPSGFARECKLVLESRYRGFAIERASGDPKGFDGSDEETGDRSMFEIVQQIMDITIFPAETNELDARQDGVRQLLRYRIDGRTPAILISPRCKMIRKGFASHYRYRKRRGQNAGTDPVPEKNEYSNPHDALQYVVMDLVGLEGIKRGELMGGRGDRVSYAGGDEETRFGGSTMAKTDFSVWNT